MFLKLLSVLFLFKHTVETSENTELTDVCGQQGIFNKILGGEVTAIDEYPWIALLEYKNSIGESAGFGCSGSLISSLHVLTTAHCVQQWKSRQLELYSVRLGEYNVSSEVDCVEMLGFQDCADIPQDILVQQWYAHPDHHKHNHDIAVITLAQRAKFTDFVRPICLPSISEMEDVGDYLIISGWGRTEVGYNSSVKLKLRIPVVSFPDCYQKFNSVGTLLDSSQHICAGSLSGKDSCSGDSGGPLMTTLRSDDGRWRIVGVVSIGNNCGVQGWPAIYIRVSNYRKWIDEQISDKE